MNCRKNSRQEAAELAGLEASQKELNRAEHWLQVGHLKFLTHLMGEDVMRNICNDSVSKAKHRPRTKKKTTKKGSPHWS